MEKFWRGGYGDVRPVQVMRRSSTMLNGTLRDGYYKTEVQAWAGILAAANDDVDAAAQAHRRLVAEAAQADLELTARRVAARRTEAAYDAWRFTQLATA